MRAITADEIPPDDYERSYGSHEIDSLMMKSIYNIYESKFHEKSLKERSKNLRRLRLVREFPRNENKSKKKKTLREGKDFQEKNEFKNE